MCSLAESCDAAAFAAFKAQYPDTRSCRTSTRRWASRPPHGHLLHLVQRPEGRRVDPGRAADHLRPDRNLGSYVRKLTGRENMVLWDGACHVHEEFSLEKLLRLKREHPAAKTVVHPECRAYIVEAADFVGSTAAILDYCGRSDAEEFIVVTESGILAEMKRRYPAKRFIPAPPDDESCGCNDCRYMEDGDARKYRRLPRKRGARDRARRGDAPCRRSGRSANTIAIR